MLEMWKIEAGGRRAVRNLLMVSLLGAASSGFGSQTVFIRLNQLGFLPHDLKTGVVMSARSLDGSVFTIRDINTLQAVFSSTLSDNRGPYGRYPCVYALDFSAVDRPGRYVVDVESERSYEFEIGDELYNQVIDSLMFFFRAQRCGPTEPLLHGVCHSHDATSLITDQGTVWTKVDATGGWHDAGDYVKFLNTAAYTTYTLLFAYEFDPIKFGFDKDGTGVPDILEEAEVGLNWLLRVNYSEYNLITQVQDLRDHDQGWRRPEEDRLSRQRPAFVGIGKNLIGIYTATMALAHRIWADRMNDAEFADRFLTLAENFYSIREEVPDLATSGSGMYQDTRYEGKMALGAIELYITTGQGEYLSQAKAYAHAAGSDYWWSWGDLNSFAHYRLASIEPRFREYIYNNLKFFDGNKNKHVFGEGLNDSWGSNSAVLGVALQAILWKALTGETTFDSLAIFQRDFILGKNQWGVSFIYNIGTKYSSHLHSQVAYFNNGRLPGAVAAGPISKLKLDLYQIHYEAADEYAEFQTATSVYRDDRMDYVTNEPTISTNAIAVFVMGYYSKRDYPSLSN